MALEFGVFGNWLEARGGAHRAALRINRYLAFFQEIDAVWGRIPGYDELVSRFHAEGLRRVRLAVRWMEETGRLMVDGKAREEDSERRRIRELGEGIDASIAGGALWHAYRERLIERHGQGRISLRSIRMALSAAADLVGQAGGRLPTQADLDAYLLGRPGQKANITGFVNFINAEQEANLVPRIDEQRHKEHRRSMLEHQLVAMMKNPDDTPEFRRKWARVAMKYFHGRPMPKSAELTEARDGGLVVRSKSEEYWVPLPQKFMCPRTGLDEDLIDVYTETPPAPKGDG